MYLRKRTLSFLAIGALLLMHSVGLSRMTPLPRSQSVFHRIRQVFNDAVVINDL